MIDLNHFLGACDIITYDRTYHRVLYSKRLGDITLLSGQLVVCDPLLSPIVKPTAVLSPGTYPVWVTQLFDPNSPGEEVAAVFVPLTDHAVTSWQSALGVSSDGRPLGYSVDSATSSLMSWETAQSLNRLMEADYEKASQQLYDYKGENRYLTLDREDDSKIFVSGLQGDGGYPCYLGYDKEGKLSCVLAPFQAISDQYTTWDQTIYPPIPAGFDDHFFDWLRQLQPYQHFQWELKPGLSQQEISALALSVGGAIPADIQLYYRNVSPWSTINAEHWKEEAHGIQQKLGRLDLMILPLVEDNWVIGGVDADGSYKILEYFEGYHLDYGLCKNNLKFFLIGWLMRDMGEITIT